jgi:cobalt-zinc-cadmium efflux system outer membrane protein
VEVSTSLTASYEALMAAHDEVLALRTAILPEARSAFTASQEAYQRGRMRLTDVLDTQRTLFELQSRYFNVLAVYHASVADLERLIGEPLANLSQNNGSH